MKKLILTTIIASALCLASAFTVHAVENVTLPTFDVTINGITVENEYREYPFIVYNDITYFPMTYYDCRYLGLITDWENSTKTLSIEMQNITCTYRDYVGARQNNPNSTAGISDFNIVVNGKEINNKAEEYPLLIFRDVTYFPLTWRFAYDEFGWSYSFTPENGLVITSYNYHPKTVEIPDSAGFAAFDGEYYYYNATKDGKNVVCRASASDLNAGEIIFELPESPMTHGANFINGCDGIYIEYATGWSATSYTEHYRKINSDGTLTEEIPDKYLYSKHGSTIIKIRNEKITVEAYSASLQVPFTIKYIIDGKEIQAEIPENLAIGVKINGKEFDYNRIAREDLIKIHGDKIYFLAYEYGKENETSDVYVIDTKTGKSERLIENAEGAFHVYTGWDNKAEADSTMIIFGHSGNILRYSEKTDEIVTVKNTRDSSLVLEGVSGKSKIYTAQKSFYGDRTIVSRFDCYASGTGSINQTILDTATGTYITFTDGLMAIYTAGESADDSVRTAVVGVHNGNDVCLLTSDVCSGFFARSGYLTYSANGNKVVVGLK